MSTIGKAERDAADRITESIEWDGLGPKAFMFKPMAYNQFLNGIEWARANPSAEVKALVEALEYYSQFPFNIHANEALAAYRAATKQEGGAE